MSGTTELIGVDWGSSNLRVMRLGHEGAILESRSDQRGAARLTPDEFPIALSEVAGNWLREGIPVVVCGMAGARGKWLETGYCDCPAGLADLAPVSVGHSEAVISIVPGVSLSPGGSLIDVMRGEETQVMGLPEIGAADLVVTPGTHSKWINLENGLIKDFRTFMTGDLFAAIKAETILGQDMGDPGVDSGAFEDGVARSLSDRALTAALFSVRVERLANRMEAASSADYLLGMLIGAEIAGQATPMDRQITVIGGPSLNPRYAAALVLAGYENVKTVDGSTASARGLWRINKAHRP